MMQNYFALFLAILSSTSLAAELPLSKLHVPDGWRISVYAGAVPGARSLTQGPNGVVFVGTQGEGKVYALLPGANGKANVKTLAKDLNEPNGVAFKNGDLYVAEINRILVLRGLKDYDHPPKPQAWGPSFPPKAHHGWKFIAFGPDGWLYVPVGAPCNVCDVDLSTFAALHRVSPDGKTKELVAAGIRNTVGFDWDPKTNELWFTDNGRDLMGDDIPADELNHITATGQNFGFPFCHEGKILDPKYGAGKNCADYVAPAVKFPAHVAALGMRFLRHQKDSFNGDVLVAFHGSWNRTVPQGYEVQRVVFDNGKALRSEPFVTGFLQGKEAWGRPVDVLELTDGSVLISDDKTGSVYRLSRAQ